NDAAVRELAQKVSYEADPDSPFPDYYSGEVVVETTDGRTLRHREEKNRGAGDRPLSTDDIIEKFMQNATLAVSRERAERVRDLVLALDGLDALGDLEDGLALCGSTLAPYRRPTDDRARPADPDPRRRRQAPRTGGDALRARI